MRHWTYGSHSLTLDDMTTTARRDHVAQTAHSAARARRAARRAQAMELTAYPATRSAAMLALPAARTLSVQSPQQVRTPKAMSREGTSGTGVPVTSSVPVWR